MILFNSWYSIHICIDPSLFITNNIWAPQGDELGLINPCYNNSSNSIFNSPISNGADRYGVRAIRLTPGTIMITNSIRWLGGTPGNSLGNTSRKSITISTSYTSCFSKLDCVAYARYTFPPLFIPFRTFPLEIRGIL